MRNERVIELEKLISQYNESYWEKSSPEVDDPTYDALVEELRSLDPDNKLLEDIGSSDNNWGKKVPHKEPVLSLAKVYSWGELVDWCKSVARSPNEFFCFSPKLDGCSLTLDDGMLLTRGKGRMGTDISHLAPWIKIRLSYDAAVVEGMMSSVLRDWRKNPKHWGRMTGELLVPLDYFEKLKNSYPQFADYKTPRNLASGFTSLKPDSELLKSLVHGGISVPVCTWVFHRAKELRYPLHAILNDPHLGEVIVKKLRNFKKLPTDGVVCRLEDDEYAKSLGSTQHHPRGAMALKFGAEEFLTEVKNIVWQVGNDAVTPVAVVDPREIDGATIERATAHNAKYVLDNGIAPGAEIKLIRQGSVIPKIVEVTKPVTATVPDKCPCCEEPLTWSGPDLVCTNPECVDRIVNKIVHGLGHLGIKGIGPSIVERLVRELHLPNIMCFCLTVPDDMLLKAKGFTTCERQLICGEIDRVTQSGISDADLFASLCIPQASTSFAEKCISEGIDLATMDFSDPDKKTSILSIPGINSTAVANTEAFMSDKFGDFMMYWNLFNHQRPVDASYRVKYCFTGALPYPRKEMEQWVLDHGAYPTDNIRRADYLVSDSPTSTSSKMRYARSHDIPVITFKQLLEDLEK